MSWRREVSVDRSTWEAIRDHASRDAPHECCGLLLGRGDRVVTSWSARNIAASPAVRYEIDPQNHFAAVRGARELGVDVIGAYHSHPRSAPSPSPTDLAEALADFLYVILGPVHDAGWHARAFELRHGNFEELGFVIMP